MATVDSTLSDFMKLDYNTREMLLDIMKKRQIEARRNQMAKEARKSVKEYRAGKYTPQTAAAIIDTLKNL